jgi:hypothetical protein
VDGYLALLFLLARADVHHAVAEIDVGAIRVRSLRRGACR